MEEPAKYYISYSDLRLEITRKEMQKITSNPYLGLKEEDRKALLNSVSPGCTSTLNFPNFTPRIWHDYLKSQGLYDRWLKRKEKIPLFAPAQKEPEATI